MERDYTAAVVIGRFQPFHNNHRALLEHAFAIADKVIVLVGSAHAAPTPKNPFSFEKRAELIRSCYPESESETFVKDGLPGKSHQIGDFALISHSESTEYAGRLVILPVRDYFYSDSVWVSNVQALTDEHIQEGDTVALMGAYTDASSYYLNLFPQWEFVPSVLKIGCPPLSQDPSLSGTTVRDMLFDVGKLSKDWQEVPVIEKDRAYQQDNWFSHNVPESVAKFLAEYRETPAFGRLADEWKSIHEYKKSWAGSPFPPIFVTADAVVTCSGHVLIIKRGFNPGKGTYALPGGFIRLGERIRAAAIRELKEETRIRVDKLILDSNIVDSKVFDHPERSLRGRTITHAYHIKLKDGKLPEVKQGSDAKGAFWMPLMDVGRCEDKFFEDHAHIISYFVNKS